jgi:PilZ domain
MSSRGYQLAFNVPPNWFGRREVRDMDHEKITTTFVDPFLKEQRAHVRFSFKVLLRIRCREGELITGRTLDVSESGIAAIVSLELIVGQSVELSFQLPSGPICIHAVVKNKTAFRYGFEFVLARKGRESLKSLCMTLAFKLSQLSGKNH